MKSLWQPMPFSSSRVLVISTSLGRAVPPDGPATSITFCKLKKKETVDLKAGEKDVTSVTWSMGKFNSLLIMHTTSHFDHLSLLNVFIKDML